MLAGGIITGILATAGIILTTVIGIRLIIGVGDMDIRTIAIIMHTITDITMDTIMDIMMAITEMVGDITAPKMLLMVQETALDQIRAPSVQEMDETV